MVAYGSIRHRRLSRNAKGTLMLYYYVPPTPTFMTDRVAPSVITPKHAFYFRLWRVPNHRIQRYINTRMSIIMARRTRNNSNNNSWQNYEFADVPVATKDREKVQGWIAENEQDFFEMLDQMFAEGYSLKLRHSEATNSYVASLVADANHNLNKNTILTAHAGEGFEALGILIYKHVILSDSGEWSKQDDEGRWG